MAQSSNPNPKLVQLNALYQEKIHAQDQELFRGEEPSPATSLKDSLGWIRQLTKYANRMLNPSLGGGPPQGQIGGGISADGMMNNDHLEGMDHSNHAAMEGGVPSVGSPITGSISKAVAQSIPTLEETIAVFMKKSHQIMVGNNGQSIGDCAITMGSKGLAFGSDSPVLDNIDSTMGGSMAMNRMSMMENNDIATGSKTPLLGSNRPELENNFSAMESYYQSMGVNRLSMGSNGPITGSNGPATGSNGPATGSNGPGTGSNGPVMESNGPRTGSNGPAMESNGPATGSSHQIKGIKKLTTTNNGSTATGSSGQITARRPVPDNNPNGESFYSHPSMVQQTTFNGGDYHIRPPPWASLPNNPGPEEGGQHSPMDGVISSSEWLSHSE